MTAGIHHVTAICGDAQKNVDFYAGVLGLRLVKRTVNFDDPQTYHLYYGDTTGAPGTLMTFFPWPGTARGRVGPGQVAVTSFALATGALGFWIERLIRFGVRYEGPTTRRAVGAADSDEQILSFEDPDGLKLEIVATPLARDGEHGNGGVEIPRESAIRGIHGVTLWEENEAPTASVLVELLGLERAGERGTTARYVTRGGAHGTRSVVDVRVTGDFPRGHVRVGNVHHVAYRVSDEREQLEMRERLLGAGLAPTPVIDRQYFRSVYFREPGGVLFELATDRPGFAVDEPADHLGERLMLPPHLESNRPRIEQLLPEIHLPGSVSAHYRDGDGTIGG